MTGECETELLLSDRFIKVETAQMYEAIPTIERLQGPFLARPKSHINPLESLRVRATNCGRVAISTFKFGTAVEIEPQGLEGAILVTTGITGRAGVASGGRDFHVVPGASFISHEEDRPSFLYDPDTEVLKLRFERHRVEEMCLRLYDRLPDKPLHFDQLISDLSSMRRWAALLRFVVASINVTARQQPSGLEATSLEEMLTLTLLSIQPHNHLANYENTVRSVSPRQYRLAVDYINERLETDITLPAIAEAAGCSIRSLARGFQHAAGTSPMQFVHRLRLQRIKADLVRPRLGERTIADIAYHWGYRHLGEFNRQYRLCFGETPSETRRRHLG